MNHHLLFGGYQSRGIAGHAIRPYGPRGGYSAHADQNGLLRFVTGTREWPTDIRVVQGERKAKQKLITELQLYSGRVQV
ncbi:MBL fold metallo-hydrolase RNA specificity domain-containing protein [Stutzerimonas stutzeri]|uniref:MBL fold metallo-hydrolase RNA specificity domain-containing protein n=1 Tax=Stutzerimonas stutzeri TaxID=316 RepID=UPI003132DD77